VSGVCVYTDGRNKIQLELEIQPVIHPGIFLKYTTAYGNG